MINYVDVIGLGGTGSNLLPNLVRLMSYHDMFAPDCELNLIDGDKIEDKNLERAFKKEGVGQPKVEWCRYEANKIVQESDKSVLVYSISRYINKDEYLGLLADRPQDSKSICIATVDNDDTRRQLVEAIDEANQWVMFISPGNEEYTGQVVSWLKDKDKNVGFNPLKQYDQWVEADPSLNPGSCAYEAQSFPQLLTTNMLAAVHTLTNIQLLIDSGYFRPYIEFNLLKTYTKSADPLLAIELQPTTEETENVNESISV